MLEDKVEARTQIENLEIIFKHLGRLIKTVLDYGGADDLLGFSD